MGETKSQINITCIWHGSVLQTEPLTLAVTLKQLMMRSGNRSHMFRILCTIHDNFKGSKANNFQKMFQYLPIYNHQKYIEAL